MIRVPDAPTGHLPDTGRHRLGTARVDLAPRYDYQDCVELGRARRRLAADAGCVDFALCRDFRDSVDFGCARRRLIPGVGRVDLALRRGYRDFAEPARARRRLIPGVGRVDLALRRGYRDFAEPARTHQRLIPDADRVAPPPTPSRHEASLIELTPVADEAPLWWGEWRPPGREAA